MAAEKTTPKSDKHPKTAVHHGRAKILDITPRHKVRSTASPIEDGPSIKDSSEDTAPVIPSTAPPAAAKASTRVRIEPLHPEALEVAKASDIDIFSENTKPAITVLPPPSTTASEPIP